MTLSRGFITIKYLHIAMERLAYFCYLFPHQLSTLLGVQNVLVNCDLRKEMTAMCNVKIECTYISILPEVNP